MGLSERKEREKAELKELILDAAKRILLKNGKEGLSIRKIAHAIEYSPATIYLYFPDKDAILHELMEIGFGLMSKYLVPAFAEQDPVQRIHSIGKAYAKFGMENKDWYDLMFNSEKPMKHIEKCAEEWDQGMAMFNFLTASCKQAIDLLGLKGIDERILALHFWSTVHGLVNLAHSDRLEIIERNQTRQLIDRTLEAAMASIFRT
ncbi:MAG: TetR/AcrR family transcriptional regulator [Saprospiraceae bacterium]|nr:TetR/AcrR family transcriptional regulator [Saprospiraceae bacterium]MBP9210517.1 TetR/AcrR family transcriptional regulator [Saprospiraceae bacterium]MBV6473441.1 hypothetical protein [Saprospiraceae bacterium]